MKKNQITKFYVKILKNMRIGFLDYVSMGVSNTCEV